MEEYMDELSDSGIEFFVEPVVMNKYSVYIDEQVENAKYYRPLCEQLRCATENDHFTVYIISYGGDLDGAIAVSKAIEDTRAHVHGVLVGTGASGGSMIFFACHTFEVNIRSRIMIHQPTGGAYGKHSENKAAIQSDDEWFKLMYKDWYGDFLTDTELDDVLDNKKDLYFHYDELSKRLPIMEEKRAKRYLSEDSIDDIVEKLTDVFGEGVSFTFEDGDATKEDEDLA